MELAHLLVSEAVLMERNSLTYSQTKTHALKKVLIL